MIGLKRGTVTLLPHQKEWEIQAEESIVKLKSLLGDVAVDIQHIGSTAIKTIQAKPILDLVIGVRDLNDIKPYVEVLERHEIIFRGGDQPGQLLFVMGDFSQDTRTHHIHVVRWKGQEWNQYLAFRDYLNHAPEKAKLYEECKQELAKAFPHDRISYTEGKQKLIDSLLEEAAAWKDEGALGRE